MRAGKLEEMIDIQFPVEVENTMGEVEISEWATFAKDVWARVETRNATEQFSERQRTPVVVKAFIIRFQNGIHEGMRVRYQDQNYNILGINKIGRNEGLEIQATTNKENTNGLRG